MADQKVVDYIKQQRAQKIPDNAISEALLKAGYKKEDVDEGFKILSMSTTEIPVTDLKNPATPAPIEGQEGDEEDDEEESGSRFGFLNKKMIILIGVAVVLLVLLLGSMLFLTLSSQNQAPAAEEEVVEEEVIEEEPLEEEEEVVEEPTAVPTTVEEAKALRKQEDIQTLVAALEQFYSEKKYYPANLNDLYPIYLDRILINPDTLGPYKYFMLSNGREYVLCETPDGSAAKECAEPSPTAAPTTVTPAVTP